MNLSVPRRFGVRQFFNPRPLDTAALSVAGIGVHEQMKPGLIRRPRGTGDHLFMLFHDEAHAALGPEMGPARPGETMMIWAPGMGQFYGHENRGYGHTWIHCDGARVRRWLRETRLPVGRPFAAPSSTAFPWHLMALHEELVSHVPPDPVIASNILENALHQITRGQQGAKAASPAIDRRLLTIRQWIGGIPSGKVTLEDLAKRAGMSVPHFCASFKGAFGQPPIACLIEQRLNFAAYLLADRNLTISAIATRAGYDDAFRFSKAFKRHFGHGPRELRRLRHGW